MAWTEKLRSGKWQGKYRTPDGKVRSAGSFPHKSRALREAASKEAEARKVGWRNPDAGSKTWAEWQKEWWPTRRATEATKLGELSPLNKHLLPRWGNVPVGAITRHDVKAWIADLLRGTPDPDDPDMWLRKPLSPASVHRYFTILRGSMSAALDAEIIDYDPTQKLTVPSGETDDRRFLTREEAQALLDAMPKTHDLAVVMTLLGTGMRWGEAIGLQVERVDFERMRIRVSEAWVTITGNLKPYPKGRRMRFVPLSEWLAPTLEWAIAGRRTGFVLGDPVDIHNWRNRVWNKAVADSGIGHVRIHDLRHTYASWRLQDGVPLAEVGQLLGHTDWKTTMRYAHLEELFSDGVKESVGEDRRMAFAWQRRQV